MITTETTYNPNGGPRTPEGKAKCSRNAQTHGLTGSQIVIPGENQADYDALVASFQEDFLPQTHIEATLVNDLAKFHWLKERAIRLQVQAFFTEQAQDPRHLSLMIRYQNSNQRAFNEALKTLQAIQKERLIQESKSVSKQKGFIVLPKYDKTGHVIPNEWDIYPKPKLIEDPPKKAA
jgi:hypothetical protein